MKNTKDAIKYGIETLKVSPDEMFSLIESSRDYEGDDYKRWLASQIIKIAEKDGVGYSQLLVKRFNIISDLLANEDAEINKTFFEYISRDADICHNFDEESFGDEGIDWYSGIDLDINNSGFLSENMPELYEKVLSGEGGKLCIVARLSRDNADKSSDLYVDAKSMGIVCKNEGMLFLYRMCRLADILQGIDFSVRVLTDVNFLLDDDVQPLLNMLLDYFKCTGYNFRVTDVFDGILGGSNYALIECKPRTLEDKVQFWLELENVVFFDGEGIGTCSSSIYSKVDKSLLSYIRENSPKKNDGKVFEVSNTMMPIEYQGDSDNFGFLTLSATHGVVVTTIPTDEIGTDNCIEITTINLDSCIVYFALSYALKYFNINEDIKVPVTGDPRYYKLLHNCVPLFLYSTNSLFRSYEVNGEVYETPFGLESEFVQILLEKGEMYRSFEAKELVEFCKGYSDYLSKDLSDDSISRLCFEDLRKVSDLEEFNSRYLMLIGNLCGYIKGLYKEF